MKITKILLLLQIIVLASCSSDTDPDPSGANYIVITSSSNPWVNSISNYNTLTDEYSQIYQTTRSIRDVALINSNLFTLSNTPDTISKIVLNDNSFQEISKKKSVGSNRNGMLEEYGNQLLMLANKEIDDNNILFLNFYDVDLNLIDSLVISETPYYERVTNYDILAVDDKIFLSIGQAGTSFSWITIIDAISKKTIGVFETGVYVRELVYRDKVLYGFSISLLHQVDINTMSLSSTELHSSFSDARSSSVVFTSNNTFYFFQDAPQPAPAPYMLASYNISNGSADRYDLAGFIKGPPMRYDSKNDLLVTSGSGIDGRSSMKLFRLDGSLEREVNIPEDVIDFILIR